MRKVVSSAEVYHLWANQAQEEAYNASRSVSFRGASAYSYAREIARIVTNEDGHRAYLFGLTGRDSVTTAKHQSHARRAIPGSRYAVFHVATLGAFSGLAITNDAVIDANLLDYSKRVLAAQGVRDRARNNKAFRAQAVVNLKDEANAYARFFGRPLLFSLADIAGEREEAGQMVSAAIEQMSARRIARQAEMQAELATRVPRWLEGQNVSLYHHPTTMLRLSADGSEVETSRGARVPVTHARMLFAAWHEGRVKVGARVGHYTVAEVTPEVLTIGCHRLEAEEISRFAAVMGWKALAVV